MPETSCGSDGKTEGQVMFDIKQSRSNHSAGYNSSVQH